MVFSDDQAVHGVERQDSQQVHPARDVQGQALRRELFLPVPRDGQSDPERQSGCDAHGGQGPKHSPRAEGRREAHPRNERQGHSLGRLPGQNTRHRPNEKTEYKQLSNPPVYLREINFDFFTRHLFPVKFSLTSTGYTQFSL